MPQRFAAIDLGTRRTGVAVADDELRIATPLTVIERSIDQGLIPELVRLLRLDPPNLLIIGLPLNMDGTEGPQAALTRRFGAQLHAALIDAKLDNIETCYHDERLTSAQADWHMAQSGLTHKQKKSRRDAIAAAALLNDWLSTRS